MARAWAWLARLLNHQPGNITATILLAFLKPCAHALSCAYPTQFPKLLHFLKTTYKAKIRDMVDAAKIRALVLKQSDPTAEEQAALMNLETWLDKLPKIIGGRFVPPVPKPTEASMPEYKPPDDTRATDEGGDF